MSHITAGDLEVLLLDFGGVCLLNPVELHRRTEDRLGLAAGSLSWLGPIDPTTDDLWRRLSTGDMTEREYWATRAAEVGELVGKRFSTRDYMRLAYEPPGPDLVRPEAVDVASRARVAGYRVSVLTNDLRAFHDDDWIAGVGFFDLVDVLVDCSDTGILKPDPKAFARAADLVGMSLDRMLFVDDQPVNITGAEAVGLESIWFDVAAPTTSWQQVADRLALP